MAEEYDLYPVYKAEFHQVFEEHQEHPEFGPLMVRMKVVDANGESAMDEDQWEAASECLCASRPHKLTNNIFLKISISPSRLRNVD